MIEEPDSFFTYRLTDPYTNHSPFVALGVNGLQSSAYKQAHAGNWSDSLGYAGPLAWIEDQVAFLFDINMNTIAGWLTHIQSGGEDKWFNTAADSFFFETECDCPDSVPSQYFTHSDVAGNAELVRQVNLNLGDYNQTNSGKYPRIYFPFVMYLYPMTPYDPGEILEDMLPDIWSDHFERRLYLMSYLVLSDGTEPEEGNECDGRWKYENTPYPVVEDIIDVETLLVPEYFICHKPEGMRKWRSLISYALSDDVQWAFSIDTTSSYSGEYRPWIRRILCQAADGAETPPGRTAFAQAMNDFYWGLNSDPIWEWNNTYFEPDSFDFRISRFMEADTLDPRYTEFPSLEKMPNPDCIECMKTSYPNGINEDNNGQIGHWLQNYETDLGRVLTKPDAEEFTRVMAAYYYPMVIDAIRFFDGCHLISSANFNWFRKGGDFETNVAQFYTVFEEMSKATGNVFTDIEKDNIAYINTQFYPILPERVPGATEGSSYGNYYCDLARAFNQFLIKGLRGLPFMVASYTSHADWEKEWDFNWHESGTAPCPKNTEPVGDERWYDCAPFPHGDSTNCTGIYGSECFHPRNYRYTESGLLDRPVTDPGGEYANGRGDDYCLVTDASFYPAHFEDPPFNYNFILGYSWHSFYDSGFGEQGQQTAACENWGIVNPKCFKSLETSEPDTQYIELHDSIRDRNGQIQVLFGDGSTWSNKPGPDPPPETTDPFVCDE